MRHGGRPTESAQNTKGGTEVGRGKQYKLPNIGMKLPNDMSRGSTVAVAISRNELVPFSPSIRLGSHSFCLAQLTVLLIVASSKVTPLPPLFPA